MKKQEKRFKKLEAKLDEINKKMDKKEDKINRNIDTLTDKMDQYIKMAQYLIENTIGSTSGYEETNKKKDEEKLNREKKEENGTMMFKWKRMDTQKTTMATKINLLIR